MKKSTIAVIAVLAALAVGVGVLAALNGKTAKQADTAFLIAARGQEYEVSMVEFLFLPQREIEANYKKNGKDPENRYYIGASFAEVLRMKGIDPAGISTAAFSASDGYASILPIADALDMENCFIVLDSGREGPFRMILAKDQFSQRWCKLLTSVTLK